MKKALCFAGLVLVMIGGCGMDSQSLTIPICMLEVGWLLIWITKDDVLNEKGRPAHELEQPRMKRTLT